MKSRILSVLLCGSLAFAGSALAESAPSGAVQKKLTPQQERMKSCNKDATGKKGDDRKTFMSQCLSGESASSASSISQQEKMKVCNVQATDKKLKGAERKTFMSACLKK